MASSPARQQVGLVALNESLGGYGISCNGYAAGSHLVKEGVTVGGCSILTVPCVDDATQDCVEVALDYEYDANPLTPELPGVGLVLPDHLVHGAVTTLG